MKLLYVGDPMCSWCYGFGKELSELMAMHSGLDLEIIVGGVRAGATDVLDQAGKEFRLGHWARVEAQSGLPFNRAALMARENFVYNTEPVCRAVVAARKLAPQADLLAVFRALQHAFYVDGRDTTSGRVLAEVVASQLQLDVDLVLNVWQDSDTIVFTKADFVRARALGVRSFPALLLDTDQGIIEISGGYAHGAQLHQQLQQALASFSAA
ncbi:DsbA family protein [Duganella sp. FT135W]|uniref:DsbA family protein n=1 Tax=Duganella flavida TaxID=2692175 RepID=A0A6L8KCZ3_9BURK|nr:DsbA family protein [Duganella flavida]MYM24930.1 DsbA family protein [Duganella flavida]